MVIEIKPPKDADKDRDEKVLKMLVEAIRIMGGPQKLAGMRNLTWLPSLIRAMYAVLLRQAGYTYDEIASKLGITRATVEKMLTADEEAIKKKIEGVSEEEIDEHVAGGIAKLAYKEMLRRGVEEEIESITTTSTALGIDWPIRVTTLLKGVDFPVDQEMLMEKLSGVKILGTPAEEILKEIEYPVTSPVDLVKKISDYLRRTGKVGGK